jgi:hypothetical protein
MTISIFLSLTILQLLNITPLKANSAYLDPGSGSFILQLLLAALVGSLFIIKSYWKKISEFFRKLFTRRGSGEEKE